MWCLHPHPPEFRQRAVELPHLGDGPVTALAKDLGISESCLRSWMAQADEKGEWVTRMRTSDRSVRWAGRHTAG